MVGALLAQAVKPVKPRRVGCCARLKPWRRGDRGQALVEFALVLPVFLLVFFGLLDMGRYVYLRSVLSQAAREGARLGSVEAAWVGSSDPSCNQPGGPVCPASISALQADVAAAANRMVAPFGPITSVYLACTAPGSAPTGSWTGVSCGSRTTGDLVSVRVVLSLTPLTPVVGQLVGTITASGSATMVIN